MRLHKKSSRSGSASRPDSAGRPRTPDASREPKPRKILAAGEQAGPMQCKVHKGGQNDGGKIIGEKPAAALAQRIFAKMSESDGLQYTPIEITTARRVRARGLQSRNRRPL